jgi:tetratricopeptide (TPR) repeat protein
MAVMKAFILAAIALAGTARAQAPAAAPDEAAAHYARAKAASAGGDWEQAKQEYAKALELRPRFLEARLDLARLQAAQRDFDAALASVDAALKIDTKNIDAQLIRAAVLIGQRKTDLALRLLEPLLAENPNNPDVRFQSGVVNLAAKRYPEAEAAFRKTWELEPDNARGLAGAAETYLAQNQPGPALELLQAEVAKRPARADLHLALANIAVRSGKYDLAAAEYQKALPAAEGSAAGDIYLRLAETLRRKGDVDSSLAAAAKARELMPRNPVAAATLAMMLDGAGRKKEALQAYEAAIELDPANAMALNNLAFLLADTGGDLQRALELAQRARDRLPGSPEVNDTVGWIYFKANMISEAAELFRSLVAKQPENPGFRYHLGAALARQGQKAAALEQLRQAQTRNLSPSDAAAVRALIRSLE